MVALGDGLGTLGRRCRAACVPVLPPLVGVVESIGEGLVAISEILATPAEALGVISKAVVRVRGIGLPYLYLAQG